MDLNLLENNLKKQKRWYKQKTAYVGIKHGVNHRLIPCFEQAFSLMYGMIECGMEFSHYSGWIPIFKTKEG